jgi:hypothetical protein
MPNLRHFFAGGWASDLGPTTDVSPDQAGHIRIPFLVDAENILYELDGGPHKIGGTEKLNSSAVGSAIRGCYDYWKHGTGGTPSRRKVLHAGTTVLADNDDNVFANIFTGLENDAIPSYATFDDILIISSSSNSDVPKSWDQTTAQNLGGTPPNFAFSTQHHGRQWAAGVDSAPSVLYYSVAEDPEDWVGAGSGSILIDPGDGDRITGIASHKNDLWVFKGPYKGSIHRITGTSPSDFARTTFITGLGAAWHNSIFKYGEDLGFISQFGTFHSLNTTAAYGDFNEAAISRPIQTWLSDHLNYNRLKHIWAVNSPLEGIVLFSISIDASNTNNAIIGFDYRFNPVRWFYISAYNAESMALFTDTNNVDRVFLGGTDGFLRRSNIVTRSIDGSTSISYKVTTPFLTYGNPMITKTIERASVGIAPKGNFDGTFSWERDNETQQSETFSQAGGDVLGPSDTNEFTLGTSKLGGARYIDYYMELEEGGEARDISYQFTNNNINEDLEIHSFTVTITPGAESTEN